MPRRVGRPPPDARDVAHEVLVRVDTTDAFADVLLAARLAETELSAADRALATRLVYGTLAWRGRLDHHLGQLVRLPWEQVEVPVRNALRMGLYQLLFLERVPAYAAVDASVRLARRGGRGAAGLVNAVLRRAASAGPTGLPLPDPAVDPLERLAVEWSHPRWLVERWAGALGLDELTRLLAADNLRGPTALRANTVRAGRDELRAELTSAGVTVSPSEWAPDALVVQRRGARLRRLAAWHEGRFAFQGEASQLVAPLLGVAPGARVLDACAAPGGKTAQLAALGAVVVALDRAPGGLRRLRAETGRLGVAADAVAGDARQPPLSTGFDAVLVDAPCSGLGTLRRHPEVRWRRHPEDVPRLAALQRELLAGVAPLVRPGGTLVYAVCTLTREENAGVVSDFLTTHPHFALEPVSRGAGSPPAALVTPEGFLTTFPHRHGLDGFFAARLRAHR
jgi:16S rRNA (cytosine967-C5)-methyltransferase